MSRYRSLLAVGRATSEIVIIRIGGMGSSMLMTLILARSLGPAQYGTVALAQSAALIAAVFVSLNVGSAAIRFVPELVARPSGTALHGYLRTVHRAVLGSGVGFWLVLGIAALVADRVSPPDPGAAAVMVALLAAPVLALLRVQAAITHALGAVLRSTAPTTFVRPVLMLGLVALYPLTPFPALDPMGFAMLFVASATVAAGVQLALYRRAVSERSGTAPRGAATADRPRTGARAGTGEGYASEERHAWFGAGWQLLIPVLFLESSIDLIVLLGSTVLAPEDLAALGVVLRIQGILLFGVTSVNMVIAPRLAKAQGAGQSAARDALIRLSGHLKLWPSLVLLGALAVLGRPLLGLFGEHYTQYLDTLMLFALMPVILALYGPSVLFATVLGLQREARRVFLVSLGALALTVPALGAAFGVDGVAVAVLAIWWGWNRALHALILRSAGFSTAPVRPLRPVTPAAT